MQQATKVELTINLRAAKALGLPVPLPLLSRADEVIDDRFHRRTLQELCAGLEQSDPDDVPGSLRSLARFVDGYIFGTDDLALLATRSDDYYVFLRSRGRPLVWSWEIQRRSKPMGVRVYGDGFPNEFAAKLAGEKALRELLDNLANEPGDINPNQLAAPSCEKCGGSTELARVVPGLGTLPELLLFRCTGCGQVTKQKGRPA